MKLQRIVTVRAGSVSVGDVLVEGSARIPREVVRIDISEVNSTRLLFRYSCNMTDMFHPRDIVQVGIFGNDSG